MRWILLAVVCGGLVRLEGSPFQATGFKIGEVRADSAVVWTRATFRREANGPEGIMPVFVDRAGTEFSGDGFHKPARNVDPAEIRWPAGKGFNDMRYAAPGVEAETQVQYRARGRDRWQATPWAGVRPDADYTRQAELTGLEPNTTYDVRVFSRSVNGEPGESLKGEFITAPARGEVGRVSFTVSTGQAFHDQDRDDGFEIYPSMLRHVRPSFFVHTGDIVYYDRMAKSVDLAHWHWQRTYSRPTNVNFHRLVGSYFIKDDHDTWTNDSYPGMKSNMGAFTWEEGVRVFREQVPMRDRTWRRYRWGRDLEIWLVEGRDFRSPNPMPDGPGKTIWGAEQKQWVKQTMAASDATFRILISPTPIVGPDRSSKNDNHANAGFATEGKEVRGFLSGLKNAVVVCGDRHWQYHSIDPETGLREYSCGPASDPHAGGWSQKHYVENYHRFLRVKGGFLSATAERVDGRPRLTFRFHGVDGAVHFEDVLSGE